MTGEPEKRPAPPSPMATHLARMMLLERAAVFAGGQDRLAEALGIKGRSLRKKFSADRGVSDDDMELAALAMEARAAEIIAHAAKLRAQVTPC